MPEAASEPIRGLWWNNVVARDRYVLVLFMTLATVISSAFFGQGILGVIIPVGLMSATLMTTLTTSDAGPRALFIARVVIAIAFVGTVMAVLIDDAGAGRFAFFLMMLTLSVVTPFVIARRLSQHITITANTVAGAADVYLLVGLFFAVLYATIGTFQAGAFNAAHITSKSVSEAFFYASRPTVPSDFLYFSYITMTTVGYGDLTATSAFARMLAASQALLGQLYLVTVVAVIVANIGRTRRVRALEPVAETDDDAGED